EERSQVLAAVVVEDQRGTLELLCLADGEELDSNIGHEDQHQESGAEDAPVPVRGEVLQDFLSGGESGTDQESDDGACVGENAQEARLLGRRQVRRGWDLQCHGGLFSLGSTTPLGARRTLIYQSSRND